MRRALSIGLIALSFLVFESCKNSEPAAAAETAPKQEVKAGRTLTKPIGKAMTNPKSPSAETKTEEKSNSQSDAGNDGGIANDSKQMKRYTPTIPDDLFFGMYRSPCFGQCPVYNLDIKLDGTAILEGKRFFDYTGFHETKIDEATMIRIMDLADKYGYFNFQNVYDQQVTDVASTLTILRTDEQVHWVYDRMDSPEALRQFEMEVETIIKDLQWRPMESQEKE